MKDVYLGYVPRKFITGFLVYNTKVEICYGSKHSITNNLSYSPANKPITSYKPMGLYPGIGPVGL